MNLSYEIVKLILRLYHLVFRQDCYATGLEHWPVGSKIIAANHPNATDVFHLPFIIQEKVAVLSEGHLFSIPIIGKLLLWSGQIPVYRSNMSHAFYEACHRLQEGATILLFPEGRLNPDGSQVKAHNGAVRLAQTAGVPIIPLGIHVSRKDLADVIWRAKDRTRISRWQLRGTCYLSFGEPWYPNQEHGLVVQSPTTRELTSILMGKIDHLADFARQESQMREGHNLPQCSL